MDKFGEAHQILSISSGSQTSWLFKEVILKCLSLLGWKKIIAIKEDDQVLCDMEVLCVFLLGSNSVA